VEIRLLWVSITRIIERLRVEGCPATASRFYKARPNLCSQAVQNLQTTVRISGGRFADGQDIINRRVEDPRRKSTLDRRSSRIWQQSVCKLLIIRRVETMYKAFRSRSEFQTAESDKTKP